MTQWETTTQYGNNFDSLEVTTLVQTPDGAAEERRIVFLSHIVQIAEHGPNAMIWLTNGQPILTTQSLDQLLESIYRDP